MKAYTSPVRRYVHTMAWAGILAILFFCLHAFAPAQTKADPDPLHSTPSQLNSEAWKVIDAEASQKKTDTLVMVVNALGDLGGEPRAQKMLFEAVDSPDIDVRTAAISAMAQTKNPVFTPKLRKLLDDPKPQIAFAAASTLWNLGDRSGEDLLIAVVQGDRKGDAGVMGGAMHQASRDMHNPVEIAKMTAPFFLGPFGIGFAAYNYMHRAGGDSPRVIATELLAQDKSPAVRTELIDALDDKDTEVKVTAARMLGGFRGPDIASHLSTLFGDSKPAVRITAAVAAIRVTSGKTSTPLTPHHHAR